MVRPTPKIRELLAFRTLLQTGSASEAARVLDVSQPAISKSVRQLEASLGFSLFERKNGRLRATPEAELLLPAVDDVFTSVSALTAAGQSIRDERVGQVTVGVIPTLAHVFLPGTLRALRKRHPKIRISVQILTTRQIVDALVRGVIDIGLAHDLAAEPMLQAEDFGRSPMCAVVPRGHRFWTHRRVRASDLRGEAFVSFTAQSPIGQRISAAFADVDETYAPTIEVSASTALCAISAHCGIVGIVERYVLSLGWWPTLRPIPLSPSLYLRPRILSLKHRPMSAAGKRFCEEYRHLVTRSLPSSEGV
jgi:DNA-binding transcriptional LysR family regulator